MKYVIEIIEVDKCPENWTDYKSWPGRGLYKVKTESYSLYYVNLSDVVTFIPNPALFIEQPFVEQGGAVSEALLLKAIAAASRAEVLK